MSSIYDLDKIKEEIQKYRVIRQDLMEEVNDARRGLELMSEVMDALQFAKTQLRETEEKLKETKKELKETKKELKETKKELKETKKELRQVKRELEQSSQHDDEWELV